MIGIIAGEIIGSPYRRANLERTTDIFFPLFEPQVVLDRKTYRERTYRPEAGNISHAALSFDDLSDLSHVNPKNLGEVLAGAIVLGDLSAADSRTDPETKEQMLEQYARWFPEDRHRLITSAYRAAYGLRSGVGADIRTRMGTAPDEPARPEVLSALLKGQLMEDGDGAYRPGDGKPADSYILDAAFYSVANSTTFEEAVRRATALGGDSAAVAAITGGLAELAFGIPENIAFRAREMLDTRQELLLRRYEAAIRTFTGGEYERIHVDKDNRKYTEVDVLALPGRSRVYSVPEGRQDIENAIRKVNRDSVFVHPEGMRKIVERMEERKDSAGSVLSGTFIDSQRPELRHLYFFHADGKLYSPSTIPMERTYGFGTLDERLKTRSEFLLFVQKAEEIRREQELKVGHNPGEGHLRFASAWYLQIERDRVVLMKGPTPYGAFGLDSHGRMRVDTNVVGGSFSSEYLQGALDNQKVFHAGDSANEILAKISEKCLDDGYIPDPEKPVPSNMDLMLKDLSLEQGELRRAAEVTDEILADRTSKTRFRMNYASSSEVTSLDQAVFAKAHNGAVFTIGHSNLSITAFINNCRRNGITTVRDVRSWPYSKNYPQFNREELKASLEAAGIRYVYNGDTMGGHIRRSGYPSEAEGVTFSLSQGGYAVRARENAKSADLTIAFAADFNTAGEKVTAEAAKGKIIQVPLEGRDMVGPKEVAGIIMSCMTDREKTRPLVINIAGNGISVLERSGISQSTINATVTDILKEMVNGGVQIRKIISGGQTGVDEAGIIAAKALCIPAEVHAPKGWMMRGQDGKDIFSEYEFKSRFAAMPDKELSYQEMMGSDGFRKTYDEIVNSARAGQRQAVMCAETSPTDCHRFACIGFALEHPKEAGRRFSPTEVHHIKRDGQTIPQSALERKVCRDSRVEYSESNVAAVMRKVGERIQHPKENDRPISLSRNQPKQNRR